MVNRIKEDNHKDLNSKQSSIIVKIHTKMSNRGQNNVRRIKGTNYEIAIMAKRITYEI